MAKDEAIRNQKVFIRLDNLVEVNNELNRVREISEANRKANKFDPGMLARVNAIQWVLDKLQLPHAS